MRVLKAILVIVPLLLLGVIVAVGVLDNLAVKRLFGEDTKVMLCSTKSMTGHTLGAAGAIELIATLLAMNNSLVPPTINQEEPDPECLVDCVPNVARKAEIKYALSNSFGFGGHNASVLAARYPLD